MKHIEFLNIGKITSALTIDILRLELFFVSSCVLFSSPIIFIVFSVLFILELGWIGIIGIAMMVFIALVMIWLSIMNSRY